MNAQESQKVLQTRAREVLQSYPWGRFKELSHNLYEKGVRELGARKREQLGEEDALLIWIDNGRPLCPIHGLETGYRTFLKWILDPDSVKEITAGPGGPRLTDILQKPEWNYAESALVMTIGGFFHSNFMTDLSRTAKTGIQYNEEESIFLERLDKKTLDALADLHKALHGDLEVTSPAMENIERWMGIIPRILNALYNATLAYCREKGYLL